MYRCTREEIEKAPTCGGLYLFYSADLDLLYIGKARNLRHRIKQHLFPRGTAEEASNTRKIKHRFHYVCFLPIREEGDRREVEREENKMICPKCDGLKGYYKIPADYWGKCDCCGTPEVMRSPDPNEHWQKCEFCNGEGRVSVLRLSAEWRVLRKKLRKMAMALFYKECPVCGMKARKIRRLQNA